MGMGMAMTMTMTINTVMVMKLTECADDVLSVMVVVWCKYDYGL